MSKNILETEVTYEPLHEITRGLSSLQTAYAKHGDTILWHEKTIFPHNVFKDEIHMYSFDYIGTKEEMENLAKEYNGEAVECPYEEGSYYPQFSTFEDALKFHNEFMSKQTTQKRN